MTMSDRIAVMDKGRIEQVGPPGDLYAHPATRFVADFLGESNLLDGTAKGGHADMRGFGAVPLPAGQPDGSVTLLLRPEALRVAAEAAAMPCRGQGKVVEVVFLGQSAKLRMILDGGGEVLARLPLRPSDPPPAGEGETVAIGFSPEDLHVVPRG